MSNQKICQISSERIDDVVLLLNVMKKISLPEIINQYLPRHWKEKGLNWGWVATIWLSYILSQGDHRKVKVREWVNQRSYTLETVCDLSLRETDFTDDRLGILLKRLSHDSSWSEIETDLSRNSIRVDQLPVTQVRMDATTLSGYHLVSEEGLLDYSYDYQIPTTRTQGRYQITAVTPKPAAIEQVEQKLGWRAYVTNAPCQRLSLPQAVLTYREEWIAERSFHRLKGVPLSIAPFFVQRDDQVKGLVHLLSLAVRILTLIEFVVRRRLQESGESLTGLAPGNPLKRTQRPTAERLLSAFKPLTLTLLNIRGQDYGDVTPLNPLQSKILRCLGLSPDIYSGLVENST